MSAPVRDVHGHRFLYLGQLSMERDKRELDSPNGLFCDLGVRLYQELDKLEQYLCIESAETGEETWYRVEGTRLTPESP